MNVAEILDQFDSKVVNPLGLSRLKNQVVGNGYIAGLKALVTILNIPKPTIFMSQGASLRLCETISQFGLKKVQIVTDQVLFDIGVLDGMIAELDKQGMKYSVFTEVEPDPTFSVVEKGLKHYRRENCDCVLAVGGGSSIDAAKVIALAATNQVEPKQLVGILKGKVPSAPFFVVPTTAGTGSEATIGAVISDTMTHKKELVIDTKIVPMVAALDPVLMKGLPPAITAATGVDALTHLNEAYFSTMANDESDYYVRSGIQMIFENLPAVYKKGNAMKAREKMALASYYGGLTINIAGLGYVHAFAHQLGARYRIPHGESNAKVLPHVLEFNKQCCAERMAELATMLGLCSPSDSVAKKAQSYIDATKALIESVGIEPTVPALKTRHFNSIIQEAFKEANSTYAVPKYMSHEEALLLLRRIAG